MQNATLNEVSGNVRKGDKHVRMAAQFDFIAIDTAHQSITTNQGSLGNRIFASFSEKSIS